MEKVGRVIDFASESRERVARIRENQVREVPIRAQLREPAVSGLVAEGRVRVGRIIGFGVFVCAIRPEGIDPDDPTVETRTRGVVASYYRDGVRIAGDAMLLVDDSQGIDLRRRINAHASRAQATR